MPSSPLNRRRLLRAAGVAALATAVPALVPSVAPVAGAAVVPPVRGDIGVSVFPFELEQVRLTAGRWLDNQNRTLTYLRFIDVDRLLYNFRANHRLSTNGAAACGGWEAPDFEFRTHSQGHFLSAWANAWARMSTAQMQTTLQTEFGGMNAVLADLYQQTGDARWLTTAQRLDHAVVFDPLAAGKDRLNGLHAAAAAGAAAVIGTATPPLARTAPTLD